MYVYISSMFIYRFVQCIPWVLIATDMFNTIYVSMYIYVVCFSIYLSVQCIPWVLIATDMFNNDICKYVYLCSMFIYLSICIVYTVAFNHQVCLIQHMYVYISSMFIHIQLYNCITWLIATDMVNTIYECMYIYVVCLSIYLYSVYRGLCNLFIAHDECLPSKSQ